MSTLINGLSATQIDSADRGLHYGDGLFETISCSDGRARWLPLHLTRLRSGCERLYLRFTQFEALEREIATLCTGIDRCIVKVIVTRGVAARRGYAPTGEEQPTRIVARHPWPVAEPGKGASATQGFRVACAGVTLGANPALAGLKHLNRLEQVLAQRECQARGLDEVLMLSNGAVIGGSMSNLFLVTETGLVTPALDDCGVAGVMRARVLSVSGRIGLPVQVRPVGVVELAQVAEAFLTNVRWELQSIALLEGRALSSQRCARQLREALDAA